MSNPIPHDFWAKVYTFQQVAELLQISEEDLWCRLGAGEIGLWPVTIGPGQLVWSRAHFRAWLRIGRPPTVGYQTHQAAVQQLLNARPPVAPVDLADVDLTAAQ